MKDERERIFQLLRTILRPIARLCVRHTVSVRDLLELIKRELLNAAQEACIEEGQKVNVSRLSVITGIQRKDIIRITQTDEAPIQPTFTIASRTIGQWEQDNRFLDTEGNPKILTIDGEENEFKQLVQIVSKDLNSGTVLAELDRQGLVEKTPEGLRLLKASQTITDDHFTGYGLLAADFNDLTDAVTENLSSKSTQKNLHARTEYDNIYVRDVPKIKEWLVEQGSKFHDRVRSYLAQYDQDIHPDRDGEAGVRVVLGTYSCVNVNKEEENDA